MVVSAAASNQWIRLSRLNQARWRRTITGTRRYVRRQRSWFNRDKRIQWLDAAAETTPQALRIVEGQ